MVCIEDLTGFAFQAENGGHTFEISGIDEDGNNVSFSGTVAGVFRRPDNADIALTGVISGGKAYVTLSEDCYAVNGSSMLTIYVTDGGQKVAVYSAVLTVTRTSGGAVAGDTPQDIVDLINAINEAVSDIPADYTLLQKDLAEVTSSVFTTLYTPANSSYDLPLSKGSFNASTGNGITDSTGVRWRTQTGNFCEIGNKTVFAVFGLAGYEWACFSYSGNTWASATHSNTGGEYVPSTQPIVIPANSTDSYFCITIRKISQEVISDAEVLQIRAAIRLYNASIFSVDPTLSVSGAAADAATTGTYIFRGKGSTYNLPIGFTWWEVPNTFDANNPIYPADVPYNSFTFQTGALLAGFADKGVPIDTSGSKAYWVFRFRSFHNTSLTSYLIYSASLGQLFCAQSSNGGSTLTVSNFGGGKTASVLWLGDSISRGRLGGQSANASIPIPNRVAIETGMDVQNFGIGNIGFCAGWTSDTPNKTNAIGYLKRVGDPDYYDPSDNWAGYKFLGTGDWSRFNTIVIALGTNDNNYPLGSLSDIDDTLSYATVMAWKTSAQDSDASNRTIVKALYQCYRYIRESEDYHTGSDPYVPNGKYMNIILSDPIISGNLETGTAPEWGYNVQRAGGFTRMQLNQLLADFAQKYGCGHISNYDAPIDRMHLANSLPDGIHPDETTYQQLGRHFAGKLTALVQ